MNTLPVGDRRRVKLVRELSSIFSVVYRGEHWDVSFDRVDFLEHAFSLVLVG